MGPPGSSPGARVWYLLVHLFFVLGLMAKPMLVTLPLVLLLLDVWPLGRLENRERSEGPKVREARTPYSLLATRYSLLHAAWPLVREKVPLLAFGLAAGVIAFVAQLQGGAVAALETFPPGGRVVNAFVSYAAYVLQMFWPARLVAFYPYPQALPLGMAIVSVALLAAVSVAVLLVSSRRPHLAVGWCWYVVTLLPVAGLLQLGSHARADRYTYVPLVGVFIMLAWLVPPLSAGSRARRFLVAGAVAAALAGCVVTTRAQVTTWRDSRSLWQHAVDVMPDNYYAHNALGLELAKMGRSQEAMAQFVESKRLAPGFPNAYENIARLLTDQGKTSEAMALYGEALRVAPGHFEAHNNLGNLLAKAGRSDEAAAEFRQALALRPDAPEPRMGLANVLLGTGRAAEAIALCDRAIALAPESPSAHYNLANALRSAGQLGRAIAEYHRAIELNPRLAEAHNNLGVALEGSGRIAEAIAQYQASLQLEPRSAQAHANLGRLLAASGRLDEAVAHYLQALSADPDDAQVHTDLGCAMYDLKRFEDAAAEHRRAIALRPQFADAHYNFANTLAALGRFSESAAEYQTTMRLEGESADVKAALAAVLRRIPPAAR